MYDRTRDTRIYFVVLRRMVGRWQLVGLHDRGREDAMADDTSSSAHVCDGGVVVWLVHTPNRLEGRQTVKCHLADRRSTSTSLHARHTDTEQTPAWVGRLLR